MTFSKFSPMAKLLNCCGAMEPSSFSNCPRFTGVPDLPGMNALKATAWMWLSRSSSLRIAGAFSMVVTLRIVTTSRLCFSKPRGALAI